MLQKGLRRQVQSGIVPIAKIQLLFSALVVEEGLVLVTTQSVIQSLRWIRNSFT